MECPACAREVDGPGTPADITCCFWCGLPAPAPRLRGPLPRPPRAEPQSRAELKARQRRAVELVDGQGMSLRQAAREMGLGHASTVMRLVKAGRVLT